VGTLVRRLGAERRLRESEERFHGLVDSVTDYAIFMLDTTGHIASWNAGAERTKGYRGTEIIGTHFSVFYTPEERAAGRPERNLEIARRDGRFEEEAWRVRKDGSLFWADVIITAQRDDKGSITGFAKITRDLTERRAAQENEQRLVREQAARAAVETERQRLRMLLTQVPATINFLRGPELVWEFVHPNALKALGGRDVIGKPLLVAVPEMREQPYYERVRRVYETGELSAQCETPAWHEVGGRRIETYWDSVYLPIPDASGAVEGVMTFEVEVTETVRARQEMERVNRAKDEFLATMSHELRTPLNAIYGWATILRKKPREEQRLERGLEVIERNVKAQTRLIGDLLDVSRIIAGKLSLKLFKTDVVPVILMAADVVRPAADAKGVRLVVDVDPHIGETMADPERLQQVIWNLLSNAVRFTPQGGRVTIASDRTPSGITIRVQDTGAGIAADHLQHIFERFMQVDSSTTRIHGGLGLGLAIVRHLVEAHGGSVAAESEGLGRGSTFTVRLPIGAVSRRDDEAEGATSHPSPRSNLQGLRVLVVDDDVDSLEVLRMVLETAGATVTPATSARGAFEALDDKGPFEVIVSDIGMPEIDGYSFLRSVRARPEGAEIPAIALTAYARSEDAELARRAGFQEHLVKPVDEGRLVEAIRTWSGHPRIDSLH
jgi:PAS domain S-box-containing protein